MVAWARQRQRLEIDHVIHALMDAIATGMLETSCLQDEHDQEDYE